MTRGAIGERRSGASPARGPLVGVFYAWRPGEHILLAAVVGAIAVVPLVLVPAAASLSAAPAMATALGIAVRRVLVWACGCAGLAVLVGLGLSLWQAITLGATLPEGWGCRAWCGKSCARRVGERCGWSVKGSCSSSSVSSMASAARGSGWRRRCCRWPYSRCRRSPATPLPSPRRPPWPWS